MNIQEKMQSAINTISHTHPIKDALSELVTRQPQNGPETGKYPESPRRSGLVEDGEHIPTLSSTAYPGQGSPSELSCKRYFYPQHKPEEEKTPAQNLPEYPLSTTPFPKRRF